jgi:CBS domain-containing protein
MVKVKEIMTKNLVIVEANTVVREAIQVMSEKKVGSVLVRKGKDIIGILEDSDIVKNILAKDLNLYMVKVEAVMSIPFVIDEDRTDNDASDMMCQNKVRHLAVSDGKKIVGILSMADLIRPVYAGKSFWT